VNLRLMLGSLHPNTVVAVLNVGTAC
jgi:hypothetical protein